MTAQGEQLKAFGMAQVDLALSDAQWRAVADLAIRELARQGVPFSAEDVCAIAGRPVHPNAVGARISAAARAGRIRRAGFAKAQRPERHANVMATWTGVR